MTETVSSKYPQVHKLLADVIAAISVEEAISLSSQFSARPTRAKPSGFSSDEIAEISFPEDLRHAAHYLETGINDFFRGIPWKPGGRPTAALDGNVLTVNLVDLHYALERNPDITPVLLRVAEDAKDYEPGRGRYPLHVDGRPITFVAGELDGLQAPPPAGLTGGPFQQPVDAEPLQQATRAGQAALVKPVREK